MNAGRSPRDHNQLSRFRRQSAAQSANTLSDFIGAPALRIGDVAMLEMSPILKDGDRRRLWWRTEERSPRSCLFKKGFALCSNSLA